MTQEHINKYFRGALGSQCNVLFSTSDDRVFIRYQEAVNHANRENLEDKTIEQYFPDDTLLEVEEISEI